MNRTLFVAVLLPFVSAFLGATLAFQITRLPVAEAQDSQLRIDQLAVLDGNGVERIQAQTGTGVAAAIYISDESGRRRLQLSNGAPVQGGGGNPDAMGLNLNTADGRTLGRIGTINSPDGTVGGMRIFLADQQGNRRIDLNVGEDGSPSIRLLDEGGNVLWSAL